MAGYGFFVPREIHEFLDIHEHLRREIEADTPVHGFEMFWLELFAHGFKPRRRRFLRRREYPGWASNAVSRGRQVDWTDDEWRQIRRWWFSWVKE